MTAIENRNLLLVAMAELGEPSRYDQILNHALGTHRWGIAEDRTYRPSLDRLIALGDVVAETVGWQCLFRLATDADRAAAEDAAEVDRLTRAWEDA